RRSLGAPWLGFSTTTGRTLIVQAEMPERELQTRLRIMLQDLGGDLPEQSLHFVTHRGLRVDQPEGLTAMRGLIEAVEPDLIVVDPLARFMLGDENSTRDMGRVVSGLDELVQGYGVAVILVHHLGKPIAADPREGGLKLRGSSALFGAADSVILLDREKDGDLYRLTFELRHAREPEPLLLERTDHMWFEPAGPAEDLMAVASIVNGIRLRYSALVGAIESDSREADDSEPKVSRR